MFLCYGICHLNACRWYISCVLHLQHGTCYGVDAIWVISSLCVFCFIGSMHFEQIWQMWLVSHDERFCRAVLSLAMLFSCSSQFNMMCGCVPLLLIPYHGLRCHTVLPVFTWYASIPHCSFQCHGVFPHLGNCIAFTYKILPLLDHVWISLHLNITMCILCSYCSIYLYLICHWTLTREPSKGEQRRTIDLDPTIPKGNILDITILLLLCCLRLATH